MEKRSKDSKKDRKTALFKPLICTMYENPGQYSSSGKKPST